MDFDKKQAVARAETEARYAGEIAAETARLEAVIEAAKATNCLYYPINPGAEEESWQRLHDEAADRFLNGSYAGEYQQQLLDEFEKYLPERPPWPVVE